MASSLEARTADDVGQIYLASFPGISSASKDERPHEKDGSTFLK